MWTEGLGLAYMPSHLRIGVRSPAASALAVECSDSLCVSINPVTGPAVVLTTGYDSCDAMTVGQSVMCVNKMVRVVTEP